MRLAPIAPMVFLQELAARISVFTAPLNPGHIPQRTAGADRSARMLPPLRTHTNEPDIGNLMRSPTEQASLPYVDANYGNPLSINGLQPIPNWRQAHQGMWRTIRPGVMLLDYTTKKGARHLCNWVAHGPKQREKMGFKPHSPPKSCHAPKQTG